MRPSRVIVASLLLAIAIPATLLTIIELSGLTVASDSQWLNLPVFLTVALTTLSISFLLMRQSKS
ncbi:MAG: hypothetical protein EA365_07395 [Gloeocapsa sp. DLM2.Bin57]|nr:MAG: hypothetical protein EA365_07395 [Gloeocapsa sp. DLM2.Bin57]